MDVFPIGTAARKSGVATSAIRYYERIGLLPPPMRVNGRRRYDESVVSKVGVIRLAQQAGMTIAEIQTLLNGFPEGTPPSARWQQFTGRKLAELSERMAQLEQMRTLLESMRECACATLSDCAAPSTDV